MRKSILKNLICSLALTVCAFGGAATVNTLFASADESSPVTSESVATVDFNDAVLTQESGAGIRYASSLSEMEESGLRYEIKMDADTYNGLKANYGVNVTFGVFIAPRDYHEHPTYTGRTYVNDVANITGGSAIYGWKDGGLAADGEKKRVVGGPIEILNIQTNHLTLKDDGYYHFYASITNVKLANYSREFVGFGYIKLKTAEYAITETGSGNATVYREIGAEYKFATATDNARSVAWVANKLLTTGKYKLPIPDGATAEEIAEIEKENTLRKNIIYQGYIQKSPLIVEFQNGEKLVFGGETADAGSGLSVNKNYFANHNNLTSYESSFHGLVYNSASTEMVVDLTGTWASAIICDKNGMIIEARDGANNRLVNAQHVLRVLYIDGVAQTENVGLPIANGNTYTAQTGSGMDMVIPAGGFALFAPQIRTTDAESSTVLVDNRTLLRNSMQYGAFIKVYFGDGSTADNQTVTEKYVDKKPLVYDGTTNAIVSVDENGCIVGQPTLLVKKGNSISGTNVYNSTVNANWKYIDDNGTFEKSDDLTAVTASEDKTYATAGQDYAEIVFKNNEGTVVDSLYRRVSVLDGSVTLGLEGSATTVTSSNNSVDGKGLTGSTNRFAIFTGANKPATMESFVSYGVAIVLDKYGKINRVYDGANGNATTAYYYDATNNKTTMAGLTADTYDTVAFDSLALDEYLIVIQGTGSLSGDALTAQQSARSFGLTMRSNIGKQVTISGVSFLQA